MFSPEDLCELCELNNLPQVEFRLMGKEVIDRTKYYVFQVDVPGVKTFLVKAISKRLARIKGAFKAKQYLEEYLDGSEYVESLQTDEPNENDLSTSPIDNSANEALYETANNTEIEQKDFLQNQIVSTEETENLDQTTEKVGDLDNQNEVQQNNTEQDPKNEPLDISITKESNQNEIQQIQIDNELKDEHLDSNRTEDSDPNEIKKEDTAQEPKDEPLDKAGDFNQNQEPKTENKSDDSSTDQRRKYSVDRVVIEMPQFSYSSIKIEDTTKKEMLTSQHWESDSPTWLEISPESIPVKEFPTDEVDSGQHEENTVEPDLVEPKNDIYEEIKDEVVDETVSNQIDKEESKNENNGSMADINESHQSVCDVEEEITKSTKSTLDNEEVPREELVVATSPTNGCDIERHVDDANLNDGEQGEVEIQKMSQVSLEQTKDSNNNLQIDPNDESLGDISKQTPNGIKPQTELNGFSDFIAKDHNGIIEDCPISDKKFP